METAPPPAAEPATRFLWDVERYEEAVARGVFTTEDPIELIDGEIITYPRPQSSEHATARQLTAAALTVAFPETCFVRPHFPLRLGAASVPEPDLAVVRGSPRDYRAGHPRTAELVVEISDSTLAIDRGRKLRLYAREGIAEYWIVNLADDCVEVYRQPADETFSVASVHRRGESIAIGPQARPVAVVDLLP
ncbi:MAG: hypothetical protein RLZZ15_1408 [Verrucomicrobiota bacterium]|jgi:Uma2 family endonuclease